ncbi:MAG TPA: hypothetical protein VNP73_01255 [Actinomycetota bacterium]|nr:hypothetical protein [Actinomycetota bacterium]
MQQKLLNIYLNDHLAGAAAGLELAKRCRSNNIGTPLGSFLDGLIADIEADKDELEALMSALDAPTDRLKQAAAWLGEKGGRLKLNGQITGYSPLSRLIELEGLCLGVDGKSSLWRSLMQISGHDARIATFDLDRLEKRAIEQREELEVHRQEAARTAFA